MWIEVKIDNKVGIDEIVALWNNRLDCTVQMSRVLIERILEKKTDAHYYIFEGNYTKMLMGLKHDISDDTTYIFNVSGDAYISEIDNTQKVSEMWDAYQLIIKMLLEKYNRKVKLIKWQESKRIQSIIDSAVGFYALYGIIASNLEHYWLFELM